MVATFASDKNSSCHPAEDIPQSWPAWFQRAYAGVLRANCSPFHDKYWSNKSQLFGAA
jgi:hypothetical protein